MGYSTGADVGTGLDATWGGSSFAMEIIGGAGDGASVPIIDVSHNKTSGSRQKIPGDLIDEGGFTAECHLNPSALSNYRPGSTGALVVKVPWGSSDKEITGGAIIERVPFTIPFEDKMLCTIEFVWAGAVTYPSTGAS